MEQQSQRPMVMADVLMLRQCLSILTQPRIVPYVPGTAMIPHECLYCGGLYAAGGIRKHVLRCASNPKNQPRNTTALGYRRVTPMAMLRYMVRHDWLTTGKQGAD